MKLTRNDVNSIRYKGTPEEVAELEKSLTLTISGGHYSPLFQEGKWDGKARFFKDGCFAYGLLDKVKSHLDRKGIVYTVSNGVWSGFETTLPFNERLRPHQKEAVTAFFKHLYGIIIVPTRGGKTFLAGEIMRHLLHANYAEQAIFLVDTEDLYTQARQELASYLGRTIGGIRGDEFEIEDITVATIQTVQSILDGVIRYKNAVEKKHGEMDAAKKAELNARKRMLLRYMKTVSTLIVDECHEYSSKKRVSILGKFVNADKKLFLSATPYKSQNIVANYNLLKISGPEIYNIDEKELKERGVLAHDRFMLYYMDHNKNRNIRISPTGTGTARYQLFQKQVITHNFHRNMIIVNTIEICRKLNLKVLVLFSRKEHGEWIASITGDEFLHGSHDGDTRQTVKNAFLRKKGGCLLASDIFNKGVTLPEVQVFVNAGGGLEQSEFRQKKGRVLGATDDKTKCLIVDFIDNYEYFKEHSLSRIQVIEDCVLEKEDIIVLDSDDNDFYKDIWATLEDWFETSR